jgi:hypothetical protein
MEITDLTLENAMSVETKGISLGTVMKDVIKVIAKRVERKEITLAMVVMVVNPNGMDRQKASRIEESQMTTMMLLGLDQCSLKLKKSKK